MELIEVVAGLAMRIRVSFQPVLGRRHDGHQIYKFGRVDIMIDSRKKNLYALVDDRWMLASLALLIELHSGPDCSPGCSPVCHGHCFYYRRQSNRFYE